MSGRDLWKRCSYGSRKIPKGGQREEVLVSDANRLRAVVAELIAEYLL